MQFEKFPSRQKRMGRVVAVAVGAEPDVEVEEEVVVGEVVREVKFGEELDVIVVVALGLLEIRD